MAEEIDTAERDADIRTMRALMIKHGWASFMMADYGCIVRPESHRYSDVIQLDEGSE